MATVQERLQSLIAAANTTTGKTDADMTAATQSLISGYSPDVITPEQIPDYIKAAAADVAGKVKAVQNENTMTFLAMADSHHAASQVTGWSQKINEGNLHAAMAAKVLAYSIHMDFAAYLGDAAFGNKDTTKSLLTEQIGEINKMLAGSYDHFPQFRTVGNHDTGEYSVPLELTGTETLNALIADYCEGAVYGSEKYGYCYRDFPEKNLRVIVVNTCEIETDAGVSYDVVVSDAQRLWFAQTLYSLNDKPNAGQWSFLTLSHYPLDYGPTWPMAHIVKAYVSGGSVVENGAAVDFSGHNAAQHIANFHGHTHCFLADKMYDFAPSGQNGVQFDAWRVATPNSCFYRENEQFGHPVGGVEFGEESSYPKTAGTFRDTAFVVNVVNLKDKVIHSFCYGAGRDRTVGYAQTEYFSISGKLTGAALSNSATSIEKGKSYVSDIVLADRFVLDSAVVRMGGADISASAVSGLKINIPAVTGNVDIEVAAHKHVTYTNQVPLSTDTDGSIYNGTGYADNTYIGSSGLPGEQWHFTTTGFIPVTAGRPLTIRVAGSALADYKEYGWRIGFYDSSRAKLAVYNGNKLGVSAYWGEVAEEAATSLTWVVTDETAAGGDVSKAAYIRVSCNTGGNGSGLIVTIDEPVE